MIEKVWVLKYMNLNAVPIFSYVTGNHTARSTSEFKLGDVIGEIVWQKTTIMALNSRISMVELSDDFWNYIIKSTNQLPF